MKNKIVISLVCTLIIVSTVLPVGGTINRVNLEEGRDYNPLDSGWFEERED